MFAALDSTGRSGVVGLLLPAQRERPVTFVWKVTGRKTGDNLLSHLSGEALPSADYRLNERVRDGNVCFPAPMVTRVGVPEPDIRLSVYVRDITEKVSIHRLAGRLV